MFLFGEFRHLSLKIGALNLPLGMVDYHGAMECYVLFPFVRFLGPTPYALRLCSVLFGALTLVVIYRTCRIFFQDKRIAWGSAFFLSTFPAYVTGARFGTYHGVIPMFFQSLVLLGLVLFSSSEKKRWLYSAAFFQGCAVSCRSWFLFSMISIWSAFPLLFPRLFLSRLRAPARSLFLCAALFLAGAFPLTLYVAVHTKLFISSVLEHFPNTGHYDNLDYGKNLAQRLAQFFDVWSHDEFLAEAFPGNVERSKTEERFWKIVVGCSVLWLILLIVFRVRVLRSPQKSLFLLYPFLLFLFSPFTLSWPRENHLFPLIPLVAIMIVLAGVTAADVLFRKFDPRSRLAIVLAALVFVRLGDPPLLQANLRAMKGASPYYTNALYDLKDWLMAHPLRGPIVIDFDTAVLLKYLMGKNFAFERVGFRDNLPVELADRPVYLIVHPPESAPHVFQYDLCFDIKEFEGPGRIVRRFYNADGAPMIDICKLETGVRGLTEFYARHPRYAVSDKYLSVFYAYGDGL